METDSFTFNLIIFIYYNILRTRNKIKRLIYEIKKKSNIKSADLISDH